LPPHDSTEFVFLVHTAIVNIQIPFLCHMRIVYGAVQNFTSNALSLALPLFIISSRPIQLSGVNLLVKSSSDAEHLFISRELIPRYVSARARAKGNFIAKTLVVHTR
jgi:hypothetical protein